MRSLVVSIHDVSPATISVCSRMLDDLAAAGIDRLSLLVIPDHHCSCPIYDDRGFLDQLDSWQAAGHEIVLHGYYHRRQPRALESARDRAVTRIYTAGEGEFYDLEYAEAAALLNRGREALAAGGFESQGFIAPAWLLGNEAERAVRDAGFRYTTRLASVLRFADDYCHRSQSLVYSVRAWWRVIVSLGWNALLAASLRNNKLVRLGLHPPDWQQPAVRRQALKLATELSSARDVTTYADWVNASS